ncbi:MAG: amidase family protein, partial [Bacteroidota bacterium]|nr:amidase family protein [Bacteroidota bacterium]
MKCRNFFKTAALGGGSLALAPFSSCVQPTTKTESSVSYTDFDLNELTIAQLQEMMSSGVLTSAEITKKYLDRIELINTKGSELRAVIELNPEALEIAKQLDAERKAGKVRGPMHGIPVLIKDNIDTGDQMQTTAGSLALVGSPAPDDALIIRKLREAGAVLLGKTNLSEWANFRSTKSSSGWSGRGGQVRNPFCLDRSPCGSSSGTGSAVSANMCAIGIGTETDGSIVCPSGINGIVGIKPTLGLWNGDGIIPISHSQDTAGPMARTVSDAAILLGLLAEKNLDYTQFLDAGGLKNARIGLASDFFGFHSGVDNLMADAIQKMKDSGAIIVENLKLERRNEWGDLEWKVLLSEFKADLNAYLKTRPGLKVQSLADLIEFNKKNADAELKWFGQEIFELAEQTKGLDDPEYIQALAKAKELSQKGIENLMD